MLLQHLCVCGQTGRLNKEAQRCADPLTSTSASCIALDSCGHAFLASFQLAMSAWQPPSIQRNFNIVVSSPALPYDLQVGNTAMPEDGAMGERLFGRQA